MHQGTLNKYIQRYEYLLTPSECSSGAASARRSLYEESYPTDSRLPVSPRHFSVNRASAAADFTNRAASANRGPIPPISRPEAGSSRAGGGSAYTDGTRSVYTGGVGAVHSGGGRRAAAAAAAGAAAAGAGRGGDSVSLPMDSMIGTMVISMGFMLIATILAIVERVTKKSIQELCGCIVAGEGGKASLSGDVSPRGSSHSLGVDAEGKVQKEEDYSSGVVVGGKRGGEGGDGVMISDMHRMLTELSRALPRGLASPHLEISSDMVAPHSTAGNKAPGSPSAGVSRL
ncbi:hypothetical protein T484DRAFT_1773453 [Baffinella frigidus]|nr:hypothetical protein T484DRAFT_1773453 [Cryptophyta sp. CCMP2293]